MCAHEGRPSYLLNYFLQAGHQTATWLTFLSTESVVRGIGLVVAGSTNKEVPFTEPSQDFKTV